MKNFLGTAKRIFTVLIMIIAVGMMIFTVVSVSTFNRNDRKLFGYKAFVILSDSMKATDFAAGDVVLIKSVDPATLQEGDTLITLANGTKKAVKDLTSGEELLVWNFETGKYDSAPIVFVDSDGYADYEVIHVCFSDGSEVKVVYEHGFFDYDMGKYVYINASTLNDYIGHRFVKQSNIASNNYKTVTLESVYTTTSKEKVYSPVTFRHLCYFTNGVLSMSGGISGLFNIFEVDTETMTYDHVKMQHDIQQYGLLTVNDYDGMITQEAFDAFNGAWLGIAVGKGLLTWGEIAYLAERYIPLMT